MPQHSKQHFVPQSYLKAWADPVSPAGHDPYVWRFSKDGQSSRKRAPANLFHETDIYTIKRTDGSRDLTLEHGLSQIESEFARIRREVLDKHEPITDEDRFLLCVFIAAARARTPSSREHVRSQWAPVLRYEQLLRRRAATGVKMAPVIGGGTTVKIDVAGLVEHPLPSTIRDAVQIEAPLLMGMDMAIIDAPNSPGFITSDNACVWFDPEACKRPPMFQALGLGYRTIEVTLPVSPRQILLLNHMGCAGYHVTSEDAVDDLNRRTRFGCDEHFVVNTNAIRSYWFDPGQEPEDSWRRRAERDGARQG